MEDLVHNCLGFRLGSAYRRVDRLFNRTLSPIGLTHAHGYVLAVVLQAGEIRMAGIADATGFEQSTVSRLVKELARRKLVRKRKDPEDGRAQILSPAVRGEALRPALEDAVRRANDRLRRELPDADIQGLLNATEVMDRLP